MDNISIIRIVAGCLFIAVFLVIAIGYIGLLGRILRKCSPSSRTMEPGMVWLLLIPLVNIVWNFIVVTALAKSLSNEFRLRGIPVSEDQPGKPIGIAMAVCGACSIVPVLNVFVLLPHVVLWIVYWVKMSGFSRMLNPLPGASFPPITSQEA